MENTLDLYILRKEERWRENMKRSRERIKMMKYEEKKTNRGVKRGERSN